MPTKTYQGYTYEQQADGSWARTGPAQSQGVVFTDPNAANEEARAAEDQELQRQREARTAANEARRLELAERSDARAEAKMQQDLEGPKANTQRPAQIKTLLSSIGRLREKADDFLAVGGYSKNSTEWPLIGGWLGQNRKDIEGALEQVEGDLIQQQIAVLSAMNGGKGVATMANSETEARRMAASVANLNPDQSLEEFLIGLQRAEDYYLRQAAEIQGTTPEDPELRREFLPEGSYKAIPDRLTAAGAGATQTGLELPQEYQDRHAAYLRQNWGNITPDGYAQFRAGLDNEFPEYGSPDLEAYRDIVPAFNQMAAEGQPPEAAGQVPPATRDLSGFEQGVNNFVTDPFGTFATSAINSATFGIPDALAGRRLQAAEELNPKSAFFGDMIGGVLGSALGGGAAALAGAGRFAPLAGDALYGSIYGATSDEDPVTGALLGLGSAVAGDQAGKFAGRAINSIRLPDMNLSEGQRAITQTVRDAGNQDEIARALMSADELGVPMTLADASPELQSLAGSAVRFSPTTAGAARQTMAQRNQGQLDRLGEAVARDLGPVENIPQRSADLMQQARTNAGPLYDAAYAAPGAEMVDLGDLADRPTFEAALREAYNEVLDEGLDPSAVGLQGVGDSVVLAQPSWQALDYVKRGLDNVIENNTDKINGMNPAGRRANEMRKELLRRMSGNTDYAAARQAFAGPAQERAFMQRGTEAYNTRPDQLGVDTANLTPEQRQQMQLGFQSEVMGRAGNLRGNSNPWGQLNTPNMEGRMGALYGEDADIARLLTQRDLELQLAGSANRLIGNSATAEREIADEFFKKRNGMGGDVAMGIVETGALGGPWLTVGKGIADRVFKDKREAAAAAANRSLADDLGPLLLDQNPQGAVDSLSSMMAQDAEYRAIVEALTNQGDKWGRRAGMGLSTATTDRIAY